jgi:hypothetical protein
LFCSSSGCCCITHTIGPSTLPTKQKASTLVGETCTVLLAVDWIWGSAGMHVTMAKYAATAGSDYSQLSHSLSNTAHLLGSGQHLLQDTDNSILPGQTVGNFGIPHVITSSAPAASQASQRSTTNYNNYNL